MKAYHDLLTVILVGLALSGCSDGRNSTLTQNEAVQALGSVQAALASPALQAKLLASVGSGAVNASASCQGGGTVSASGTLASGRSFSLAYDFAGCVEGGSALSGHLSYDASVGSSGVTMEINGQLTFTGAVNGSCEVDVQVAAGAAGATASGTICGTSVTASADISTNG